MAGLRETLAALAAARAGAFDAAGPPSGELRETDDFGPNPGDLRMLSSAPRANMRGRPLMVVLHGCTQTGEGYAAGAGWLALAKIYGFAVLCPEQRRSNNFNLCFNWFEPEDVRAGRGEVASVKSMIDHLVRRDGLDPRRIYVTGLSAGAALANGLLAAYPEVFAGGALVAGLPFGVAAGLPEALSVMRGQNLEGAVAKGRALRRSDARPLPKISIWHGADDQTVSPAAGRATADQWIAAHGLDAAAALRDAPSPGWRRTRWGRSPDGVLVELNTLDGVGHGAPVDPKIGPEGGFAGPFLIDAGVPSSLEALKTFGLADAARRRPEPPSPRKPPAGDPPPPGGASRAGPDLGGVIAAALRKAGLLRAER